MRRHGEVTNGCGKHEWTHAMHRNWPFVVIVVGLIGTLAFLESVESPASPFVIFAAGGTTVILYIVRAFRSNRKGTSTRIRREHLNVVSSQAETLAALQTGHRDVTYSRVAGTPTTTNIVHEPAPDALDLDQLDRAARDS